LQLAQTPMARSLSWIRISIGQNRERCRHLECGAKSGQHPAGDHCRIVGSDPADQRSSRKKSDADHEQAAAAEDVAERSTGQQERRVGEIVAVHDPLQLRDARPKLCADVFQREIDD